MKYLKQLVAQLKKQKKLHEHEIFNYAIPSLWDHVDVDGSYTYHNEKIVNPYDFYYENILALLKNKEEKDYLRSYSRIHNLKSTQGNWIKESFVYSAMIRTSAAYDHDHDGYITQSNLYELKETGTFLKFIVLIPLLKEMGINTLYLLPFFKTSPHNKKGEFASCYAVSDFFKLDEDLKDPMVDMDVEDQCRAFIEACHMHDIRIVIDIIPRTNAIRSTLLKDHPDWFYWIDKDYKWQYNPPYIDNIAPCSFPSEENMKKVYESRACKRYLSHFRIDPKTLDEKKYKQLIQKCEEEHLDVLEAIEREYNITIACAYSDHINDPQDVWSDVTYLRMYMDPPTHALTYIEKEQPPYLLFDVAKSNMYPGKKENTELWNMLSDIIPYYQKVFGIDGVRIDMGHALHEKLVAKMLQKARAIDDDICFIAEEMDIRNDYISKQKGYNLLLGNGFSEESRIEEGRLNAFYYNARHLHLPVFAMSENHDSARSSAKEGGRIFSDMSILINLFMPNGVPFLNSGQEFYEVQPMNLGVDCTSDERWRLPSSDYRHGKLALFDSFAFLYNEDKIIDMLKEVLPIRKKYLNEIMTYSKNVPAWFDSPNDRCLGSWFIKEDRVLLMVANTNLYEEASYNVHFINIADKISFIPKVCKDRFSTHKDYKNSEIFENYGIRIHMKAGEVKLIVVK